jgi:hypothetical protein
LRGGLVREQGKDETRLLWSELSIPDFLKYNYSHENVIHIPRSKIFPIRDIGIFSQLSQRAGIFSRKALGRTPTYPVQNSQCFAGATSYGGTRLAVPERILIYRSRDDKGSLFIPEGWDPRA